MTLSVTVDQGKEQRFVGSLLLRLKGREQTRQRQALYRSDIVAWAAQHYYIENMEGQPELVTLSRHQAALLRFIFTPGPDGRLRYQTVVWSTVKKSGKTEISALVARYVAETWGRHPEVYCLANDYEQAKSRAFQAISKSVENTPGYLANRRLLPGRWSLQEKMAKYWPSGGSIKALAADYKGEAGSNPSLTLWTELWGYCSEASKRLWSEMTPSPTRPMSMRWVETYAGFEGESELLEGLYNLGKEEGRQLTAGELGDLSAFAEAPNPDSLIPVWINDRAGLFMYWDTGEQARRMPWQQGDWGADYYGKQEETLPPNQFRRLHLNEWVGSEGEFVPIAWWDACLDYVPLDPNDKNTPIVLAADASVSGDCTALVAVSRHPQHEDEIVERGTYVWYPPEGGKMDYDATLTPEVDRWVKTHNVVEVAFDPYQLHHWANLQREHGDTWYREFAQGTDRLLADKGLFDLIKSRRVHQSGNPELRKHVQNANSKVNSDEDTKLRIIKKSEARKIDGAVALSMAAHECRRLAL